jgi:hypothetical protein
MEYTFILSRVDRIDTIISQLQLIDGIGCRVDGTNLRVQISDTDSSVLEEKIFSAVAVGTYTDSIWSENASTSLEANALCGSLHIRLLNKYLPDALQALRSGIVVEVESIDDELVMLRMRGPKEVATDLDVITSMLMKKCSVGVSEEFTT